MNTNKENRNNNTNQAASNQVQAANGANAKDQKEPVPCTFKELKDDFLIQREIGRGKFNHFNLDGAIYQ